MLLLIIPFVCPFLFLPKQIFCYKFLSFNESQSLQILLHIESGRVYCGTENKTAEIYFAFFSLFSISHSNFEDIGKFVSNISQELLHLGFCNLEQML